MDQFREHFVLRCFEIVVFEVLADALQKITPAVQSVDWLLDRFRTAVNAFGDSVGAAVVEQAFEEAKSPPPVAAEPAAL